MSNINNNTYLTIHIESFAFETIIGILDFERISKQKVIVDLELDYFYSDGQFINYVDILTLIENLFHSNKYELLEDALEEIRDELLEKHSSIVKIHLKISKPTIIENAIVALSLVWKK